MTAIPVPPRARRSKRAGVGFLLLGSVMSREGPPEAP